MLVSKLTSNLPHLWNWCFEAAPQQHRQIHPISPPQLFCVSKESLQAILTLINALQFCNIPKNYSLKHGSKFILGWDRKLRVHRQSKKNQKEPIFGD